jgi:hypothetical protein
MKTENKRKSIKQINAFISNIKNNEKSVKLKNYIYSNKVNLSNYNLRKNLNNTVAVSHHINASKVLVIKKKQENKTPYRIINDNTVQKVGDELNIKNEYILKPQLK